jgi:hypothetical protein
MFVNIYTFILQQLVVFCQNFGLKNRSPWTFIRGFTVNKLFSNKELSSKTIAFLVFIAYFVTWLHTFPNSYNYMVFSDTPEAVEYSKELEKFEQWRGHVPSYAATVLVSFVSDKITIFYRMSKKISTLQAKNSLGLPRQKFEKQGDHANFLLEVFPDTL